MNDAEAPEGSKPRGAAVDARQSATVPGCILVETALPETQFFTVRIVRLTVRIVLTGGRHVRSGHFQAVRASFEIMPGASIKTLAARRSAEPFALQRCRVRRLIDRMERERFSRAQNPSAMHARRFVAGSLDVLHIGA